MTPATTEPLRGERPPRAVYVYEWPVRVWHWVTTLAILVLVATGYFIAKPLHSLSGEASDHFFNGLVREVHFVSAYVLAIGFLVRVYWLILGNKHSREIFLIPFWKVSFLKELLYELKYYSLLRKVAPKHVGHNALARASMFFIFVLGVVVMMITGFGLYSEGTAYGSWQRALFGWTISLAGSSMTLRTVHHFAMYYVLVFVIIHLYLVMREDIMGRASMASTMVSGWRFFRDDEPVDKDD